MEQQEPTFEGWAILELMGHNVIAGYVTEAVIGGTAMLRIDVPATENQQPYTKFFGGSAVYAITPVEEATAHTAATRINRRPVDTWIVPDHRQLPAPDPLTDEDVPF